MGIEQFAHKESSMSSKVFDSGANKAQNIFVRYLLLFATTQFKRWHRVLTVCSRPHRALHFCTPVPNSGTTLPCNTLPVIHTWKGSTRG